MTAELQYRQPRTIEHRLALAEKNQYTHRPNDEIVNSLTNTIVGAPVAVSGAGKSHLIPFIVKCGGADFSEVEITSSRPKRKIDSKNFRGDQPIPELLDLIEGGEIVIYIVHPHTKQIYATDRNSYKTKFVIQPTIASVIEQWEANKLFERFIPIGLALDGATWDERLDNERRVEARLLEAQTCVAWLRAHSRRIPIVENKTGEEETTAQAIVDILHDPSHPHPLDNLERIDFLLPQLAAVAARGLERLKG